MAFTVIYDANVLYPNVLRDLLVRIASCDLVQAKWAEEILDETFNNLKSDRPDLESAKLDRTRELMNRSVKDCLVVNYEPLIPVLDLPDPQDRHVLAAAIRAHAQVIVTANVRDFPLKELKPWGVEAKDPDAFVLDQIALDRSAVSGAVQQIADSRRRPPEAYDDVLAQLEKLGLLESAAALRS